MWPEYNLHGDVFDQWWEPLLEEVRPRGKTPPKELRRRIAFGDPIDFPSVQEMKDLGHTDNIIFAVDELDGFEHPECFDATPEVGNHVEIANALPETHPVGPGE